MKVPVLFYIYYFVLLITALVGGFRYRSLPRPLKILAWLFVFNVVEVTLQRVLGSLHIHNLWTVQFYTLIELFLFILIYSQWMKQHQYRVTLAVCFSAFTLFWIISKFTFEPLSILSGWTSGVSNILQIIFSTLILVEIVKESEIIWTTDPRFWVASSNIIYTAGSIFMFALFNKMLEISPDRLNIVWHMNWTLMIISNLFYTRAFLCKT
jgi:hypothetical protein